MNCTFFSSSLLLSLIPPVVLAERTKNSNKSSVFVPRNPVKAMDNKRTWYFCTKANKDGKGRRRTVKILELQGEIFYSRTHKNFNKNYEWNPGNNVGFITRRIAVRKWKLRTRKHKILFNSSISNPTQSERGANNTKVKNEFSCRNLISSRFSLVSCLS